MPQTDQRNILRRIGKIKFENFYEITIKIFNITGVDLSLDQNFSLRDDIKKVFNFYNKIWIFNGILSCFLLFTQFFLKIGNPEELTKVLPSHLAVSVKEF